MSDEKNEMSIEKVDVAITTTEARASPADIQARFPTLQHLNEEEMAKLNKRLLSRIDWRLMPTITVMFLMKYASNPTYIQITSNIWCSAISIASMSPTPVSPDSNQISTCPIQCGALESQLSTSDTSSDNCRATSGWPKSGPACCSLG